MKKIITITLFMVLAQVSWSQTATPAVDETKLTITDEGTPSATPAGTPAPVADVGWWDFLRMFLILGIVVGVIWGFTWFMKKAGRTGPGQLEGLKILGMLGLSGTRQLFVVEVGNEILLLGSSDGAVTLVKEISDQETKDSLRLSASRSPVAQPLGFQDLLKKFLPQAGQNKEKNTEAPEDFLKKQRDRLKNL